MDSGHAISGGVGSALTVILQFALKLMRIKREDSRVAWLEQRVDSLEVEKDKCQADRASMREELGQLREAVRRLEQGGNPCCGMSSPY